MPRKRKTPAAPLSRRGETDGSRPPRASRARKTPARAAALPARKPRASDLDLDELRTELAEQERELRSQLEHSRERYRDLFDFAPIGYLNLDPASRILEINLAAARVIGRPRAELLGRTLLRYVFWEDGPLYARHLEECFRGIRSSTEVRLLTPGGVAVVQLLSVPDAHGSALSGLCRVALVDVTEARRNEAELRQARDELGRRVEERTAELTRTVRQLEVAMSQRADIERQLTASHAQLRALSGHLLSIQEAERKRIALEVHDQLGQSLTALKMDLVWLAQRLPPDAATLQDKAQSMGELIDETIGAVRRIATRLRPRVLDDFGLPAAVELELKAFAERTGLACSLHIEPEEFEIEPDCATTLFRILQEALTNVARHAGASNVEVRLVCRAAELFLRVADDGRGITAGQRSDPSSLGLLGMHERVLPWGGLLKIRRRRRGTAIEVLIPLPETLASPESERNSPARP